MVLMQWTEEDIKRGTLITPGWYLLDVKKVFDKPSKDGKSQNNVVDFAVVQQRDSGDETFKNVPLRKYYSEKAPTMINKLLAALGYEMNKKGGAVDPTQMNLSGKKVYGMIINKEFEGNMKNEIEDFLPVSV